MKNNVNLICIITYKRPKLLNRCLESLYKQSEPLPKILIVDNDPNQSANVVFQQWLTHLPLTYTQEYQQGAPYARNKALSYCRRGWIGFVDDDSVVHKQWLKNAHLALINMPENHRVSFIVGKTLLENPTSLSAQAQYQLHTVWFKNKIHRGIADAETLDTKNCLLNCTAIHRHHLTFDNSFVTDGISGHEDTDMGEKLYKQGYIGLYQPKMVVFHHEKGLSSGLLKKAYLRGVLRYRFDKKWDLYDHWIEEAPDFKIFKPPYIQNMRRWKKYLRWIIKSRIRNRRGKDLVIALIQELFLCYFNQGYLDEKRIHQNSTTITS